MCLVVVIGPVAQTWISKTAMAATEDGIDGAQKQAADVSAAHGPDAGSALAIDAVIVGAGFAGLAAAKMLCTIGLRAVVVEARDRLGGRAFTDEFAACPEVGLEAGFVEEGCNYLHGCDEDHALFVLAHRLGVASACCPGDLGGRFGGWETQDVAEWRDVDDGQVIPLDEVMEAKYLLDHVLHGAALPSSASAAKSLDDVFESVLGSVLESRVQAGVRTEAKLTKRERGLLYSMRGRMIGYVSPLHRMPKDMVTQFFGDLEECQQVFEDPHWPRSCPKFMNGCTEKVKWKLDQVARMKGRGPAASVVPPHKGDGEDRILLGAGFGALIHFLAEGVDVMLGEKVSAIDQGSGTHVSVRLASGKVLTAPHAIVTLPVGVLARLDAESAVDFSPELPAPKLDAIKRLAIPSRGASTHEKVVMRWDPKSRFVTKVLGADGAPLQFGVTDRRFHFLNLHKYGRQCQLLCHIWADADWQEHPNLSDAEVVAEVVEALRAAFTGNDDMPAVEELVQSKVTRWALDPFTLGAYSELQGAEASEDDRQTYAATEGRVLFAGEAAVPSNVGAQCTHGAFCSGVTAALEVYAGLQGRLRARETGEELVASKLLDETGPCGLDVLRVVDALVGRKRKRSNSKGKKQPEHILEPPSVTAAH